jgi:elongation factor Ts
MKPQYLNPESVPAEVIEKEKEIAKAQLLKEGKPENVIEKIIPGKIKRFFSDACVTDQEYVKAEKKETVAEALSKAAKAAGGEAKLVDFIRFEVGEGLVKNACNMADEVAAALS